MTSFQEISDKLMTPPEKREKKLIPFSDLLIPKIMYGFGNSLNPKENKVFIRKISGMKHPLHGNPKAFGKSIFDELTVVFFQCLYNINVDVKLAISKVPGPNKVLAITAIEAMGKILPKKIHPEVKLNAFSDLMADRAKYRLRLVDEKTKLIDPTAFTKLVDMGNYYRLALDLGINADKFKQDNLFNQYNYTIFLYLAWLRCFGKRVPPELKADINDIIKDPETAEDRFLENSAPTKEEIESVAPLIRNIYEENLGCRFFNGLRYDPEDQLYWLNSVEFPDILTASEDDEEPEIPTEEDDPVRPEVPVIDKAESKTPPEEQPFEEPAEPPQEIKPEPATQEPTPVEVIDKPDEMAFFRNLRNLDEVLKETFGAIPRSNEIEVKRPIKAHNEKGTLYTGFLNITENGNYKYYNFYPKFIWQGGIPRALDRVEQLDKFPEYGSFLLKRENTENTNYSFLRNGALLNIRIEDESELQYDDTRRNQKSISLTGLFSRNNIHSCDADYDDFRCFYVVAMESGQSLSRPETVRSFLVGPPENIECEVSSAKAMVSVKSGYVGPYQLQKKPGFYGLRLDVSPRDRYPEMVLHRWEAISSDAVQSFTQRSPNQSLPYQYTVIFTGPKFCREFLHDYIENGELLTEFYRTLLTIPDRNKNPRNHLEVLNKLGFGDPQLLPLLYNRIYRTLEIEKFSTISEELKQIFTQVMAQNWFDLAAKRPEAAGQFMEIMTGSEAGKKVLVKNDRACSVLSNQRQVKEQELQRVRNEIKEARNDLKQAKQEKSLEEKDLQEISDKLGLAIEIEELHDTLTETRNQNRTLQEENRKIESLLSSKQQEIERLKTSISDYVKEAGENLRNKAITWALDDELKGILKEKIAGTDNGRDTQKTPCPDKEEPKQRESEITEEQRRHVLSLIPTSEKHGDKLLEELVQRIRKVRDYTHDDIISILACIATGYITVFAGDPGSGKTSFCDLLGTAFGLNSLRNMEVVEEVWKDKSELANRYLPVSVERGWVSKRDFIGYYNPLTETFECGDPQRYEFLKTLDVEARNGLDFLPYIVLLDEANLSQMEFYFADFMNIGERKDMENFVALGDGHRYKIGQNLRFLATINSDHTTEKLSPRLIDRSWVIKLPETTDDFESEAPKQESEPDTPVNWDYFKKAFSAESQKMQPATKLVLDGAAKLFRDMQINISRRSLHAVSEYVRKTAPRLTSTSERELLALDYAINQRFIPQIDIYGNLEGRLRDLAQYLKDNNLSKSAKSVEEILDRGEELQGYSFF